MIPETVELVIPHAPDADYEVLKKELTPERVKEHFKEICLGKVTRY